MGSVVTVPFFISCDLEALCEWEWFLLRNEREREYCLRWPEEEPSGATMVAPGEVSAEGCGRVVLRSV